MSKGTIAYVGPFSFPEGGAASRRVLGTAKTLQHLNYEVIIGSGQNSEDTVSITSSEYQGITTYSLNERTAEKSPTLIKHFKYFFMGKKTIDWLDSLQKKPVAIILYSGYSPYLLRLIPWCRKNEVPIIFDAVEWYNAKSRIKGLISPYHWNIELAMRFLSIKVRNIIAISKYLENYYSKNNCSTVRIPPTLDVAKIKPRLVSLNRDKLILGYTGTPGYKDLLGNVLTAIIEIDSTGETLQLNIAGITESQLLAYPSLKAHGFKKLPLCFQCFGVVSQSEAMKIIKNADFSVLLRPQKRYAKAGFPTKFVESLAVGTPVIANFTSDLSGYLVDNFNGLVSATEKSNCIKVQLNKAAGLKEKELSTMRNNSRHTAEKNFDVTTSKYELKKFMDNLIAP